MKLLCVSMHDLFEIPEDGMQILDMVVCSTSYAHPSLLSDLETVLSVSNISSSSLLYVCP